jgi:hypothetical protein
MPQSFWCVGDAEYLGVTVNEPYWYAYSKTPNAPPNNADFCEDVDREDDHAGGAQHVPTR